MTSALKLKELNPEINIYVLYRDMRTYGLMEDFFTEAKEKGVVFVRFEPDDPPAVAKVKKSGKALLRVEAMDPVIGERFTLREPLVERSRYSTRGRVSGGPRFSSGSRYLPLRNRAPC